MPAPSIVKGSDQFFVTTYEGNGGGQRVGNFIPFTDNGTIAKSCIFNDDDNPYLTRTAGGSPSSTRIFTLSWWVKRSTLATTQTMIGLAEVTGSTNRPVMNFNSSNQLQIVTSGGTTMNKVSNRTFEDTSKFYHFVVRIDTTQSTADDRVKIYVDGDQITSFGTNTNPSQDADFQLASQTMNIGRLSGTSQKFDGYLAEIHYADGQSYGPDTFGVTDTSTGRWIPKSLGSITYGNNGFRMQFANTAGQTIGDDTSGNTNDFTVNNIATTDITTDSPTQNHTTLNSLVIGPNISLSEGNLKATYSGGAQSYGVASSTPVKGGKYYCECTVNTRGSQLMFVNVWNELEYVTNHAAENPVFKNGGVGYRDDTGDVDSTIRGGVNIDYGASYTSGDVIGIALDADTGTVWYSKNGTWQNNASSAQIANGLTANSAVTGLISASPTYNENNRFLFGVTAHSGHISTWNFGQKAFSYTPPTGYSAIQQDNFPETTKGIPDLIQIKNRDQADTWIWQDTLRGFGEYMSSSSNDYGNSAITDGIQKSLSGGVQIEDNVAVNSEAESYVGFNWVANNGVTATDTSGDLSTELQANPTAGFSIAKFTVSGSGVRTWAHGLGKTPEFGHLWTYDNQPYGTTWHHKMSSTPAQHYTLMRSSQAMAGFTNGWGTSGPSSSLWSGTVAQLFTAGLTYIFYSYVGIEGYSKFDFYIGNGNAEGPFIYTGFKPRYVYIKSTGATSHYVFDTLRFPNNPNGENVAYEGTFTEAATGNEGLDILSNGFKIRTTSTGTNGNTTRYIYAAFAEHPLLGDGTNPCTAR